MFRFYGCVSMLGEHAGASRLLGVFFYFFHSSPPMSRPLTRSQTLISPCQEEKLEPNDEYTDYMVALAIQEMGSGEAYRGDVSPVSIYDPVHYERDNDVELVQEHTCSICHDILCLPLRLPCQHVCCNLCIARLHSSPDVMAKCPLCRHPYHFSQTSAATISPLRFRCPKCTHLISSSQSPLQHVNDKCPRRVIVCRYEGCTMKFQKHLRDAIRQHERFCSYQLVTCPSCVPDRVDIRLRDVVNHVQTVHRTVRSSPRFNTHADDDGGDEPMAESIS